MLTHRGRQSTSIILDTIKTILNTLIQTYNLFGQVACIPLRCDQPLGADSRIRRLQLSTVAPKTTFLKSKKPLRVFTLLRISASCCWHWRCYKGVMRLVLLTLVVLQVCHADVVFSPRTSTEKREWAVHCRCATFPCFKRTLISAALIVRLLTTSEISCAV